MKFWQKQAQVIRKVFQNSSTPTLTSVDLFSSALGRDVKLDVYLPPDYDKNRSLEYPLVIFNDGQDLSRMSFFHILEDLYADKTLPGLIAAGVHANHDRLREYGTARQPDYKGRGDRAVHYMRFMTEELVPYLDRHYRVTDNPAQRAVAGFSLGGLSAFDIAWARPDIFGVCGVFSGAFWWRWSDVRPEDPDADRIMHDIIHTTAQAPDARYWFQCGTLDETDDRNCNGIIDSIDDTQDIIRVLAAKGIHPGAIRYVEMEGGRHEPGTWGQAMPDFLRWWCADFGKSFQQPGISFAQEPKITADCANNWQYRQVRFFLTDSEPGTHPGPDSFCF